jgi:hypothetical protein
MKPLDARREPILATVGRHALNGEELYGADGQEAPEKVEIADLAAEVARRSRPVR